MAAYTLLAAVLAATPGADVALAARYALLGGWRAAILATGGIVAGTLMWALAVAVGLASLLAATPALLTMVRLLGGAYLIYLGSTTLLSLRGDSSVTMDSLRPGSRPFRDGAVTNVLNPKVGLFYLTVLPQFIVPDAPVLAQAAILAAIHAGFGVVCLLGYSAVAIHLGRIGHGRLRRPLEGLSGTALLAFGALALAASLQ